MSLTRVRCPLTRERERGHVVVGSFVGGWLNVRGLRRGLGGTLRGEVRWEGGTLVGGGFVGCWVRWGGGGGVGSFAKKRNVESGTSTREDRSKTAQKPLKSCLKNRSKITTNNERFLSEFLSKIWAVWAVFPKKPPKPPTPPKPLKALKSCWKTAQTAQTAQILSGFWAGSRPGEYTILKAFFTNSGWKRRSEYSRTLKFQFFHWDWETSDKRYK